MRIFFGVWKFFGYMFWVMEIDEQNFYVVEPQESRKSSNVEKCIKNVINEAGFGTFFKTLSNHETHEYKDLQLLLALAKRFWDTTCTFHFLNIEEVMLTPYDFYVITGLRLGGKRILVNDSLTSTEIKKLLAVMPSRMRSNNVPLSCLCESIPQCETSKGCSYVHASFYWDFLVSGFRQYYESMLLGELEKN